MGNDAFEIFFADELMHVRFRVEKQIEDVETRRGGRIWVVNEHLGLFLDGVVEILEVVGERLFDEKGPFGEEVFI